MFIFIYINIFIIVKILIQDRKPRLKESVYIISMGIFFDAIVIAYILASNWHQLSEFVPQPTNIHPLFPHFVDVFATLTIFLYLFKLQKYLIKKAVILTLSTMLIAAILDHSLSLVYPLFLPVGTELITSLIAILTMYASSIILTTFFVKFSGNLRKTINKSKPIQTALLCIITFLLISFQASFIFGHHLADFGYTTNVMIINTVFFVAFTAVAFVSFVMFAKSLESKYEMQAKEVEQQSLMHYTTELERNQTDIRKFKHDYQNILLSISAFIDENDFDGLKQYYITKIATTSQTITSNDIALEALRRVKVREIKSILATKLMMAQNLGINATFEADEDIEQISIDSVVLVRMLGIILDNAIEELTEIGEGRLLVGCFKYGLTTTFIIQNTCRSDIPELHQMLQAGFSTKGKNRGIGLTNLLELTNSQPDVTLETSIENNNFIQRLMISNQE